MQGWRYVWMEEDGAWLHLGGKYGGIRDVPRSRKRGIAAAIYSTVAGRACAKSANITVLTL